MAPDERICPVCHGMGWLTYDVEPGTEHFKEIVRCPVCGPGQQQKYLDDMCGLTAEMKEWTFETTVENPHNRQALAVLQQRAVKPEWMVTLMGPFGTGKTRLLSCLVNAGRAAGWTSVYMTTAALLDHLRSAYHPDAKVSFDGLWDRVVSCRILALDEMDRWNPTEWAKEKFFELIDERYRHGAERLTAFATNAGIDELPGYVASRMQDRRCGVYEIGGTDKRRLVRAA